VVTSPYSSGSLETAGAATFFSRVLSQRMAIGIRVGLISAAATGGVLVGLGLRHQSALLPFEITGRTVLTSRLGLFVMPAVATAVGGLVHSAWMILWGLVFVTVARDARGPRLYLVGAAVAGGAGLFSFFFMASAMGAAAAAGLTSIQALLLTGVLAVSLAAGRRAVQDGHAATAIMERPVSAAAEP
jgi:hypothetical protein